MNIKLQLNLDDLILDEELKDEIKNHIREVLVSMVDTAIRNDMRLRSIVEEIKESVLDGIKVKQTK